MSTEPGHFGSSTRTVKAVTSQAVPGGPVSPPVVPATTFHLDRGLPGGPGHLRPHFESDLAATGIGAGAAGGCDVGAGVRIGYGGHHRDAAGAEHSGFGPGRARRRLLPGSRVCIGISCTTRHYGPTRHAATRCATRPRRRRGVRRNTGQPRTRRHRPASAVADLPQPGRPTGRRQHHRHAVGAASAVAGRRPGGGQRDKGAVRPQRPARRLRRGQSP